MGGKVQSGGSTTSTQNTSPWGPQQPYLTDIFTGAQNLYQGQAPQFFPGATYATPTDAQNTALTGIQAMPGAPVSDSAIGADQYLMQGQALYHDPASPLFSQQAASTLGTDNAGTATLANQAAGTGVSSNTANDALSYFSNNNPAVAAPGSSVLTNIAGANPSIYGGGQGFQNYLTYSDNPASYQPGNDILSTLSSANPVSGGTGAGILSNLAKSNLGGTSNPGNSAYSYFASGANQAAANPNTSDLASSVLAQVVPSIQSQFINGGALNSPEAARATSAGATAALAPLMFNQYNQEQANTLAGAQGLSSNFLTGGALQGSLAQNLTGDTLQGTGLQGQFAQNLAGNNLAGLGLQNTAAQSMNQNYLTGAGLQTGAANDILNSILAGSQQQIGAAGTLGSQALQGSGLRQSAASTLGSQALQGLGLQTGATSGLQNAYGTGVQQILASLGLAPQTQAMPYTDLSQQYSAGAAQQANQQAAINDAVARYNYTQTLPYNQLNQYIGQVTGNYGGTTQLNQPYFQPSTGQSILSGLGQVGGAAGGISALGSLGSTLLSFLPASDRRVKSNISRLGVLANGLPYYSFRYIWAPDSVEVGVMADEVEDLHPEAVFVLPSGMKIVDYARAVM